MFETTNQSCFNIAIVSKYPHLVVAGFRHFPEGLTPPIFLALLEGLRRQSHAALLAAGANGEMTGEKCLVYSRICVI